jgi:hypothetical protein
MPMPMMLVTSFPMLGSVTMERARVRSMPAASGCPVDSASWAAFSSCRCRSACNQWQTRTVVAILSSRDRSHRIVPSQFSKCAA